MSEKIVQLPHCFWPTDPSLPAPDFVSRAEAGLPEDSLVFCCFNANHKIRSGIFDIWMRLLRALPGSVLWIREGAPAMNARFREEADSRGVDASRVIFAPRMASFAKHLGRMRQADLFLDTFPYNAHVTASDALWAGLPVITLRGQSFASRVAAGLLVSLGLEELVAPTPQAYESLALELAKDSSRRRQIRENLWQSRGRLFDIDRLVRDLEYAYCEMIDGRGANAASYEASHIV